MRKFLVPPIQPQPIVDKQGAPTFSLQRWFETVQQWLSNSGPPVSDVAPGTPLQIQGLETDGTYLYVCTGPNQWRRVLLSDF